MVERVTISRHDTASDPSGLLRVDRDSDPRAMLTDAVEPRPAVRQMDAYAPIYAGIGIALPLATGSPALDARNGQLRGVLGDPAMARRLDPASGAPLAAPDVQGDAQQGVYFPDTRPRPTLPAIRANRFGNGDSTNDDLDLLMSRGTLTAGSLERIGGIAGESAAESLVGGIGEMAGLITRQQRERNVLLNPRRMDAVLQPWASHTADLGIAAYQITANLSVGIGLTASGLALPALGLTVGLAGGFGTAGFVYGGLTGEGVWDGNKANAFGLSGLMVGAGLGLMLSGGGFLGTVTSSTLIGAGMGGYGTFQRGQTVDWRQWGAATLIGGASGAVSGAVGYGMGTSFALARANPWVTNIVTGTAASVAGSAVSQGLTYQLLPETRKDFTWNRFFANMGGAAVGGALGGAITAGLTRGLMHQSGNLKGALRCDVGAMDFFSRHLVGGAAGGFVGDAIDQHVGLTWGTKAEKERGWDWSRSFTATVMGAVTGAAGARAMWMMRACFAAGTPIRTPKGWTSIEALRPGDVVLSRDESDPAGEVAPKVVEETFQRTGRVWLLRLEGGQVIRTTPEHPFFPLRTMAWTPAAELQAGDTLRGETGDIRVEAIEDTGEYETVYNCRVADWHTYFVGCHEGSVWAHNSYEGEQGKLPNWIETSLRWISKLFGTRVAKPQAVRPSGEEIVPPEGDYKSIFQELAEGKVMLQRPPQIGSGPQVPKLRSHNGGQPQTSIDRNKMLDIQEDMRNNNFPDPNKGRDLAIGELDRSTNTFYANDSHHRLAAAYRHYQETGDASHLLDMIDRGITAQTVRVIDNPNTHRILEMARTAGPMPGVIYVPKDQ